MVFNWSTSSGTCREPNLGDSHGMTTHSRARSFAALMTVLATVFAGLLVASPSEAALSTRTMVVLGDSISGGASNHTPYNNTVGSSWRGWWSFVGASTDLRPVVYAEPGSGYSRPGKHADGTGACTGSTFEKRLKRDSVAKQVRAARVVVLEGGINDYRKINSDGTCSRLTMTYAELEAQLRPYVHATMQRLAGLRKDPKTVYVTTPWGINSREWRTTITGVIKSEALSFGFRYIDTSTSTLASRSRTYDGTHPNLAGSKAIAAAVYRSYQTQYGTVNPATPTAPVHSAAPPLVHSP